MSQADDVRGWPVAAARYPTVNPPDALGRPAEAERAATVFPQPLPAPTGKAPYHLDLSDILSAETLQAVKQRGHLTFHLIGDVGGVRSPQDQQIVADHIAQDARRIDDPAVLAYILGDIVYYNGDSSQYYPQFYERYADYPAPILSVPGNHDGTPSEGSSSLAAWVANFCSPAPRPSPDARDVRRLTMIQPNCYWTLTSDFVTIIGLYSNVPDTGYLGDAQAQWLSDELAQAPADRPVMITSHHPCLSLDRYHGGSESMLQVIDQAIAQSGRIPTLVVAGHVHNYQHWRRTVQERDVPYLVLGTGGYWQLYPVVGPDGSVPSLPYALPEATAELVSFQDDRHGFLRIQANSDGLRCAYFSVPRSHESWSAPAEMVESFDVSL